MKLEYSTITKISEGIYKDKMSKFISFAIPVSTVEEAKVAIDEYRNRYHDARHVCWGYRVGIETEESRSSDNGEPSGTAGKPIIGQLLSNNITNTLIVVIRYFGGIKLGTGGLIVAYREAAAEAISNNNIETFPVERELTIEFDYIVMDSVMKLLRADYITVTNRQFDNICKMHLRVQLEFADSLRERLLKIDSLVIRDEGVQK